jgi:hypothetical protein
MIFDFSSSGRSGFRFSFLEFVEQGDGQDGQWDRGADADPQTWGFHLISKEATIVSALSDMPLHPA